MMLQKPPFKQNETKNMRLNFASLKTPDPLDFQPTFQRPIRKLSWPRYPAQIRRPFLTVEKNTHGVGWQCYESWVAYPELEVNFSRKFWEVFCFEDDDMFG